MKARLLKKSHRIMVARKRQILAIDQSRVFTRRSQVKGNGFVEGGLVMPGKKDDINFIFRKVVENRQPAKG